VGDVRTLCFVGHSGSGKTALAEALLQWGGASTQLDNSPEAEARGGSVDRNVAGFQKGDQTLYILDAPGFGEFIEESYKGLRVAETGVLVLNAEKGLEVLTEKAWDLINEYEKPALALVHRMDLPNAKFAEILEELKEQLGGNFAPVQWPIVQNGQFVGVVDVLEQKAFYFDGKTGEVPGELADSVASAREALIEGVAEVDEALMERFLEDQEISTAEIRAALKKAVQERSVVPVLATSTQAPKSLELLVKFVQEATPSFADLSEGTEALRALTFNVSSDQYLGLMAYVKLYGGTLKEGAEIVNVNRGAKERVREILRPIGEKPQKTAEVGPGEIAVLTKLGEFALGDTFADREGVEPLSLGELPKPVFARAIEPLTQQDEEKMSSALRELVLTKATLRSHRDDVTKETIVSGMGDTQLSVLTERLKNRFGVGVRLIRPLVPYKETVTQKAEGNYKHKKQTGGRGQYGEVYLRVEPLPRGGGFEFVDEIKGGVIPGQFIPAVEKGVVEAMQEGVFGYPMTDIKVAVFFGSHHPVDSSEIAFKIAASQAFKIAVQNDTPVLLEPVMKLTVLTPREFTGDIMSSLSGKRGKILGMEPASEKWERIEAEAPLAEIQDYALELKSITQGRATLQMEFAYYQPVTSDKLREELLKREQREAPTH